jgi:PAS domain S-box-containing protein
MNPWKVLSGLPIQWKMILLLLFIFLPASGIIVALGIEQRNREIAAAKTNALLLAQSLATQQEHIAVGAKHMLSTLAYLPEVQRLDSQACDKLFRELNKHDPFYSVIAAATADGIVFASSTPFVPGTVILSDRKYVKEATTTLDFAAGEYVVGRLSRVPSMNYAYPVIGTDGKPLAVVIAGYRLDEFSSLLSKANLSRNYAVTITDHQGICLYQTPPNEDGIGRSVSADIFQNVSANSGQGTFESKDENSVEWIHAFRQLRLNENSRPYLYVIVSNTREKILHEANFKMFRNLGLLTIAGLLALSLAWLYVNAAFIRPIKLMVASTQRFGNGDMSVRSGLPHTPDELGQLAKTLDDAAFLLEKAHNELENKVAERTVRLARTNEALKVEVAERRHAEERLVESEERFRQIAENIREVFWVCDSRDASKMLYVSPAYEDVWGQTCASLYAYPRSWIDSIHPEDRERVLRNLGERGESEQKQEYRVIRPDGSVRWVLDRAFPVADQTGRVYRFAGLTEDITAEKIYQESLEASHHKLMDIIEFLPDATFAIDTAGKVIAWNREMEKLTGVSKEVMIGKGDYAYGIPFYGHPRPILIDFVMSSDVEKIERYDSIERKGNKLYAEIYVPDFLGRGAHFWGVASPLFDVNGNIAGAIETLRDLSNRKALESSLRQRENELAEKAGELQEINTALRVLLKNRDEEQRNLQNQLQENLKELVLPYLNKVKTNRLDPDQKAYLDLVESSLLEILSPFLDNVKSAFKTLTPTEIQVANLIKEGKSGKEIAELLGIAYKTVETHRYNLRIKLGLQNEKINLRSYLLSLK